MDRQIYSNSEILLQLASCE